MNGIWFINFNLTENFCYEWHKFWLKWLSFVCLLTGRAVEIPSKSQTAVGIDPNEFETTSAAIK